MIKPTLAAAALILLTGCVSTIKVEGEHISHPLAGWPCEPQALSEDEVNQVSVLVGWERNGAYLEAGLGKNLYGKNGAGFYGPSFTGTVRVGYEWRLKK